MLVTAARKLKPTQPIDGDDNGVQPLPHGEEEWEAEVHRRIAEHDAGRGKSYSLEEVDAEIRAKHGWA